MMESPRAGYDAGWLLDHREKTSLWKTLEGVFIDEKRSE